MSLQFLDDGLKPLDRIAWYDDLALNRKVLLKNSGGTPLSGVVVSPRHRPGLTHETTIRLFLNGSATRYIVVTPLDAESDDSQIEVFNLDGLVDLSPDRARWSKTLALGVLNPGDMYEVFIRQRILLSRLNVFRIQVTNRTGAGWSSVEAYAAQDDLLSLDGVNYSSSVNIGPVPADGSFTVYLKTMEFRPVAYPSTLKAVSAEGPAAKLDVDPAGLHGLLCMPSDVLAEAKPLGLEEKDEELLHVIFMASDRITRRTNRLWGYREFSERQSLEPSYRRWTMTEVHLKPPVIEVFRVAWLNHYGKLIQEHRLGDSGFTENVIVDRDEGVVYLALPVRPTDLIDIDYAAGYRNTPAAVRSIAAKLALAILLTRKGMAVSGGVSSIALAGFSTSYPEGQGFMGLIRQLEEDCERQLDQLAGLPMVSL